MRGESEQRLYALVAWRETPFFTEREQTALAWTEAVTEVSDEHVPEEVYELARRHFTEKELIDLTLASSPSAGGAGSRSAARRCRAPMIAR